MEPDRARKAIDAAYVEAWNDLEYRLREIALLSRLVQEQWLDSYDKETDHPIKRYLLKLVDHSRENVRVYNVFKDRFLCLTELLQFSYPAIGDTDFDYRTNGTFAFAALSTLGADILHWSYRATKMSHWSVNELEHKREKVLACMRNCPITDSLHDAIRKRIMLEKGQLYRDHVGTSLMELTPNDEHAERNFSVNTPIQIQDRSRPITKKKAARLLGRVGNGTKWLNRCIAEGTIHCVKLGRQSYVFDMTEFPEEVRQKLTPTRDD